ncbi:ribokinase [Pseudothermotoga thermarum]|uniref:Ribokinase n=1 Tax=Pseudothermotoga thermarum DSM 5069 TaxID=688269 RepID=F7YWW7_9THEM|nr:ribokinase [Pseudothermotoga thermarum]AEH50559.1 ribokinase [Pseudothermotoga thermarum DSM 5069]
MIAIVGSANVDLVVKVKDFTKPGETQVCLSFERFSGGKGANQAVTCKKMGADVYFLTCTGNDSNGQFVREKLLEVGLKEGIQIVDATNGFALIELTVDGRNRIIIYPGSYGLLTPDVLFQHTEELLRCGILLLQNEIPFETTYHAAKLFKENGKTVIFDPAPAHGVDKGIFRYVDIVTPNEVEGQILTGEKEKEKIVEKLLELGCKNVLLKLGEKGCLLVGELGRFEIPAFKVQAVDTTAAGDVFNGAFAAEFERSKDVKRALIYASAAAAISVTRMGAQSSIPTHQEVMDFLAKGGIS